MKEYICARIVIPTLPFKPYTLGFREVCEFGQKLCCNLNFAKMVRVQDRLMPLEAIEML